MNHPHLQTLTAAEDDDMMSVRDCAIELKMFSVRKGKHGPIRFPDVGKLLAMARRGQFPECLVVTTKHALVSRKKFELWRTKRWTMAPDVRELIREDVAEAGAVENPRSTKAKGAQRSRKVD